MPIQTFETYITQHNPLIKKMVSKWNFKSPLYSREDVVQIIYLHLFKHFDEFDPVKGKFGNWAWSHINFLLLNLWKKDKQERKLNCVSASELTQKGEGNRNIYEEELGDSKQTEDINAKMDFKTLVKNLTGEEKGELIRFLLVKGFPFDELMELFGVTFVQMGAYVEEKQLDKDLREKLENLRMNKKDELPQLTEQGEKRLEQAIKQWGRNGGTKWFKDFVKRPSGKELVAI